MDSHDRPDKEVAPMSPADKESEKMKAAAKEAEGDTAEGVKTYCNSIASIGVMYVSTPYRMKVHLSYSGFHLGSVGEVQCWKNTRRVVVKLEASTV